MGVELYFFFDRQKKKYIRENKKPSEQPWNVYKMYTKEPDKLEQIED